MALRVETEFFSPSTQSPKLPDRPLPEIHALVPGELPSPRRLSQTSLDRVGCCPQISQNQNFFIRRLRRFTQIKNLTDQPLCFFLFQKSALICEICGQNSMSALHILFERGH